LFTFGEVRPPGNLDLNPARTRPVAQGYVKVSQLKQTKQEQISTGYFRSELVAFERERRELRRAEKPEGIGSALGAARRAGALAGSDAAASLLGIREHHRGVALVRG